MTSLELCDKVSVNLGKFCGSVIIAEEASGVVLCTCQCQFRPLTFNSIPADNPLLTRISPPWRATTRLFALRPYLPVSLVGGSPYDFQLEISTAQKMHSLKFKHHGHCQSTSQAARTRSASPSITHPSTINRRLLLRALKLSFRSNRHLESRSIPRLELTLCRLP